MSERSMIMKFKIAVAYWLAEGGILHISDLHKHTVYGISKEVENAVREMNPKTNFFVLVETEGEYLLKGIFNKEEKKLDVLKVGPETVNYWHYETDSEATEKAEREFLSFLFEQWNGGL